jgi:predicted TIM-barrel fold metal-dependent hydrolase
MTISLVINKVPAKYPGIRFILAQTGGTALAMIGRFDARGAENLDRPAAPDSALAAFRTFYYDVAGSSDYIAMYTAKKVVGADRLLFGTDFQAQGPDQGIRIVTGLIGSGVFSDAELKMIDRENALRLLPQLTRA